MLQSLYWIIPLYLIHVLTCIRVCVCVDVRVILSAGTAKMSCLSVTLCQDVLSFGRCIWFGPMCGCESMVVI